MATGRTASHICRVAHGKDVAIDGPNALHPNLSGLQPTELLPATQLPDSNVIYKANPNIFQPQVMRPLAACSQVFP